MPLPKPLKSPVAPAATRPVPATVNCASLASGAKTVRATPTPSARTDTPFLLAEAAAQWLAEVSFPLCGLAQSRITVPLAITPKLPATSHACIAAAATQFSYIRAICYPAMMIPRSLQTLHATPPQAPTQGPATFPLRTPSTASTCQPTWAIAVR